MFRSCFGVGATLAVALGREVEGRGNKKPHPKMGLLRSDALVGD